MKKLTFKHLDKAIDVAIETHDFCVKEFIASLKQPNTGAVYRWQFRDKTSQMRESENNLEYLIHLRDALIQMTKNGSSK